MILTVCVNRSYGIEGVKKKMLWEWEVQMRKGSIYPESIRLNVTEYCNLGTGTFSLLYSPHSLFVLFAVVCKDLGERFYVKAPFTPECKRTRKWNFSLIFVAVLGEQQIGFPKNPSGSHIAFTFAFSQCKWTLRCESMALKTVRQL